MWERQVVGITEDPDAKTEDMSGEGGDEEKEHLQGRKVIRFKLNPDLATRNALDILRRDFRVAVNFLIDRLCGLDKEYTLVPRKDRVEDTCALCESKRLIIRRKGNAMFCARCYPRRLLYATKTRTIPAENNVKLVVPRLSSTLIGEAYMRAINQMKLVAKLESKRKWQLGNVRYQIALWEEVLSDSVIKVDGKNVNARVVVEARPGKRFIFPHWRHVLHSERKRPLTEREIQKVLERFIKRKMSLSAPSAGPLFSREHRAAGTENRKVRRLQKTHAITRRQEET